MFISVTFCTFTLSNSYSMSEITLESLNKEYSILSQRLAATAKMIVAYGGSVPDNITSIADIDDPYRIRPLGMGTPYVRSATWKEKIIYAIQRMDSMASGEISDYIIGMEPNLDKKLVKNMVMQTASAMAIGDKAELIATKKGRKNIYSLK